MTAERISWSRTVLGAAVVAGLVVACASSVEAPSAAAIQLRRAAQATRSTDSLHLESFAEGSRLRSSTDFRGRRVHSSLRAPDAAGCPAGSTLQTELIIIDRMAYVSTVADPTLYLAHALPKRASARDELNVLLVAETAADVTKRGTHYTFDLLPASAKGFGGQSATGDATVEHGRVVALTLAIKSNGKTGRVQYQFTMLAAEPAVEAPPPDRVVNAEPSTLAAGSCVTD